MFIRFAKQQREETGRVVGVVYDDDDNATPEASAGATGTFAQPLPQDTALLNSTSGKNVEEL